MTQYEMTEKLSEKMIVTMEQAKAALEASDWNMLDAALLLEQENAGAGKAQTAQPCRCGIVRKIGRAIRELIARGNRNRFVVRRNDATVIDLPVTVLALLLICAFWGCAVMLVVGLFAGCRYSFNGPDLGRENINSALGKASDAAERMKESAAQA